MAEHLAASAESRSGPSCEKESEVRSENDIRCRASILGPLSLLEGLTLVTGQRALSKIELYHTRSRDFCCVFLS